MNSIEVYRDGSLVIIEEWLGSLFYGYVLYNENRLDEMGEPLVLCVAEKQNGALSAISKLQPVREECLSRSWDLKTVYR